MFIGREKEIQTLERLYDQPGYQMVVLYGRRRIGKTSLIREFGRNRSAIFYTATKDEPSICLRDFTASVKELFPEDATLQLLDSFPNWNVAFDYIGTIAQRERMILIIDEFPYLAKAYPAILSVLQKYIDQKWKDTNLFLILSGSSVSFMVDQVLAHESPLYGRRTAQIRLQKMDYKDAMNFFPKWSTEDALYAYAACDGVPQYLLAFSRWKNFQEAVQNEYLRSEGSLFEEPEFLLREELRETSLYNSIIEAIAGGANRSNEIASCVGKTPNAIANYLNVLMSLEIIQKQSPLEDASSKRIIYEVSDNMFRFWYRFVPKCRTMIAMGLPEDAFKKRIQPYMTEFFGHIFEEICMQYIFRKTASDHEFLVYDAYGKWWGPNPATKSQEEIDIVAVDDSNILVGECKWKSEKVGYNVFNKLVERGNLIRRNREVQYVLFSKAGFEEKLLKHEERNLLLIDLDQVICRE